MKTVTLTNGHEMFVSTLENITNVFREKLIEANLMLKNNCYSYKSLGLATKNFDMAFELKKELNFEEMKKVVDIFKFGRFQISTTYFYNKPHLLIKYR